MRSPSCRSRCPGVLIATALIYVYLAVSVIPIYGTIWIIAVAYLTIYLSFGSRTMNGVVLQLHPNSTRRRA